MSKLSNMRKRLSELQKKSADPIYREAFNKKDRERKAAQFLTENNFILSRGAWSQGVSTPGSYKKCKVSENLSKSLVESHKCPDSE